MASLDTLKGINEAQIERLHSAGVRGTADLLMWGSTPDGRKEIAHKAKISLNRVTDWVHRSDLMRVKGVNDDYARLLARAGVHSIVDLSTRNPIELSDEIEIAAAIERLVKRVPSRKMLGGWIEQARLMLRHVWYHDTWGEASLTGTQAPTMFPAPRV
jgi:hypothetical protein